MDGDEGFFVVGVDEFFFFFGEGVEFCVGEEEVERCGYFFCGDVVLFGGGYVGDDVVVEKVFEDVVGEDEVGGVDGDIDGGGEEFGVGVLDDDVVDVGEVEYVVVVVGVVGDEDFVGVDVVVGVELGESVVFVGFVWDDVEVVIV